ncbi:MAG: DUF4230 domain-containing protein [Bacteroidaceae bacterium]|nr:DUF4230 domain-containing protein [Bacteroidaceae bacterium]
MDIKDNKNNQVTDENVNIENNAAANENVNIENDAAANDNVPAVGDKAEKEDSVADKVVKVVKTAKSVAKGVGKTAKTAGEVGGKVLDIVGTVAGGAAKSAGLFTSISSFVFANLQTILISMAVTAVAAVAGFIIKDMIEGPKIEDTANVVEEVKKISELTTACFYEESVIQKEKTTTKKHWIKNEIDTVKHSIVLTALCKVRAGYDLSKLGDNDLIVKGDTISIKLPAPQIFDVISNPSDYKVFESAGDWSHEEIVAMQVERKERVLQNALDHNILEKANNIGKGRVLTLFQSMGFNVINITVTEVPARVKPAVPAVEPVAPVEEPVTEPAPVEEAPAVEEQMPIDTLSQVL